MKKKSRLLAALAALVLLFSLSACRQTPAGSETSAPAAADSLFSEEDLSAAYDPASAVSIVFSGDTAQAGGGVAVSDETLTIQKAGTYLLSGKAEDQTLVVDAAKATVRLVLSDLTWENANFAAIYVKKAAKVILILEGESSLSVTGAFEARDENSVDGAVFAKDDLTILGSGSLSVQSSAHGIVAKDSLRITGGSLSVSAQSHALQANDCVCIQNASLSLTAGKDGIHAEHSDDASLGFVAIQSGTLEIESTGDGIDAGSTLRILDGSLFIRSGGGASASLSADQSAKGLKAQGDLLIAGGTIQIDSADDAIHSNSSASLTGGTLTLQSGDDGIHADASLLVSGGTLAITQSYEGLEAQVVTVSGGNLTIRASDDGINAAGGSDSSSLGGRPGQNAFRADQSASITLSGGEIWIDADGDGIDSNGSLTLAVGTVIVQGPQSNGDGPLDYDGTATVTGGTLLAIGSSGMAMNFSEAAQGSVLLSFAAQSAGSAVRITDEAGEVLFEQTAEKSFSSLLFTSPLLQKGKTYTFSAGSFSQTLTLSSLLSGSGGMGGPGSPGGGGGAPGGNPGGRPGFGF